MSRRRDRGAERRLAERRIAILERLAADEAAAGRLDRATRYAHLARRLSTRYQVPFPRSLKRHRCAGCGNYLQPGSSARVRLRQGRLTITCLTCGETKRVPLRPWKPAEPSH